MYINFINLCAALGSKNTPARFLHHQNISSKNSVKPFVTCHEHGTGTKCNSMILDLTPMTMTPEIVKSDVKHAQLFWNRRNFTNVLPRFEVRIITARRPKSAVLAMIDSVWPSDRLSDRPSVTRWYHAKTTQDTIMWSSLTVKFCAKFQRKLRERGRRMRGG